MYIFLNSPQWQLSKLKIEIVNCHFKFMSAQKLNLQLFAPASGLDANSFNSVLHQNL